jgi:hypothetical protein
VAGDTGSDLARIRRQQVLLASVLQQVTSAGTLLNPARLDAFLQAFVSNTFTDNVTIDDLVALAQSFGTLDPSRVAFLTMPTVPSTINPEALDVDQNNAPAVFDALLNDQPLPGEPTAAAPSTPATPVTSATASPANDVATGWTVNPGSVDLSIVNLTGRSGVATDAMGLLNNLGFAVTQNDLLAPENQTQNDVTVEYDPANLSAALTVAAAIPGALLMPTPGPGSKVRLLLGTAYNGTATAVQSGVTATGTLAQDTTGSAATGPAAPPLTSGELTAINAGAATCA